MLREAYSSIALRLRGLSRPLRYLIGALAFVLLLAALYGLYTWGEGLVIAYKDTRAAAVQAKHDKEIRDLKTERDSVVAEADAKVAAAEADAAKKSAIIEAQNKIINDAGRDARKAAADVERIREENERELANVPDYGALPADEQRARLREKLRAAGRLP